MAQLALLDRRQRRDRLTEHRPRRDLGERYADRLGDERHGPRGARVDLQHEDRVVANGELHVDEADHVERARQRLGLRAQRLHLALVETVRRQRARSIARVHAGLLDVLHDAADDHALAVAHGVDVDLDRVVQELVDEDRMVGRDLERFADELHEVLVVVHDAHGAAAQHVRRAHEHGIAEPLRDLAGLGQRPHGGTGSLVQLQLVQQIAEALAVLGAIDGVGRGAEDRDARALQRHRQLERRLAAELHDDAVRPFLLDHVQHVLERERLEIQPVGRVVVGGDGFRVAVDHDRFHAPLAQREGGVDAAVVELDALADPVRSRAEDDDLAAVGGRRLVFLFVGRIEVRRVRDELGGARVDGLERGADAV